MTINDAKKLAIKKLRHAKHSSPTPALDADVILSHILQKPKSHLLTHKNDSLSIPHRIQFFLAIQKRAKGLPVAYITGHKEFYNLDFIINKNVLIPKPDTETLVSLVLENILEHTFFENRSSTLHSRSSVITRDAGLKVFQSGLGFSRSNAHPFPNDYNSTIIHIADICTGSGCIGLSVSNELCKKNIPHTLTLTDISKKALEVAKKNAYHLLPSSQLKNTFFLQGDLFTHHLSEKKFDIILSNPPYIPHKEVYTLLQDGRSEPHLALDGDNDIAFSKKITSNDGLAIIRRLVPEAHKHLAKSGMFFIETGEYNASETAHLLHVAGFSNVRTHLDLSNLPRIPGGIKA